MVKSAEQQSAERRRAQQLWDRQKRRDDVVLSEREKQDKAEMAKVARLKSLRLAKEAADKEAKQTMPLSRRTGAKRQ